MLITALLVTLCPPNTQYKFKMDNMPFKLYIGISGDQNGVLVFSKYIDTPFSVQCHSPPLAHPPGYVVYVL